MIAVLDQRERHITQEVLVRSYKIAKGGPTASLSLGSDVFFIADNLY
jgi:hypothetical protein